MFHINSAYVPVKLSTLTVKMYRLFLQIYFALQFAMAKSFLEPSFVHVVVVVLRKKFTGFFEKQMEKDGMASF